MNGLLERVRGVALLPETQERDGAFQVADAAFARVDGADLHVLLDDGWQIVDADPSADWALVEDRIARGWELAAPDRLLEAGGR